MAGNENGPAALTRGDGRDAVLAKRQQRPNSTSWRAVLGNLNVTVAPAADRFPMLDDADLAKMAADIEGSRLHHPLILWRPTKAEPWQLADGRNRCAAMALLQDGALRIGSAVTLADCRTGGDLDALIHTVNVQRRHLSPEQKRQFIAERLRADPAISDRLIAGEARVDHKTVANVRKHLEDGGEIPHHPERTGRDGVKQPARPKEQQRRALRDRSAPGLAPIKPERAPPAVRVKDWNAIKGVEAFLRRDPETALREIANIVYRVPRSFSDDQRVEAVRAFAIGIGACPEAVGRALHLRVTDDA